jgi:ABC-type branched-subunit amino acid transport system permease subunit
MPEFDPFGEQVPATDPVAAPKAASNWMESAGISLFWGLVGVIVLARALYFEPGAFSFAGALAWAQGLVTPF